MRKKLLSLLLVLTLCAALAVPALADGDEITSAYLSFRDTENHTVYLNKSQSGTGWSFDLDSYTLTLDGFNAQGLEINNISRILTVVLSDGSVNDLTTFIGLQLRSCEEDVVITGGGTLNIAGFNAGFSANKKVVLKSGTVNMTATDGFVNLNGGGLQIEGGTFTSKSPLWRTSSMENNFCRVTGGTLILDTQSSAVKLSGADVATGLEGAVIVGMDGQALQITGVDGFAQLCDGQGNVSAYAKITASGSDVPAPAPSEPSAPAFSDVSDNAWYAESVNWAVAQGITNGTSATTFSPEATCTRGQIITFLYRAAGSPTLAGTASVSDAGDTFYTDAVLWAAENGLFSGTDFSPEAPCTREMAVEFMWKYAGSPAAAQANFTDVTSDAVNWAVAQGVTNGTSETTFSPEATCTRAQIVTFLSRAFA